jgi:hypothetical protein
MIKNFSSVGTMYTTEEEIAAHNAICRPKRERGDYGKILWVANPENTDYNTFPTSLTVRLVPAVGEASETRDVTVWHLSAGRECGQVSPQFGYVDPDTRTLWFLTLYISVDGIDKNGKPVGNVSYGFITYDNDGNQVNKAQLMREQPLNIMDILSARSLEVDRASDGSQLVANMPLGNENYSPFSEYSNQSLAPKREGGKRKTRRSKKSKKHTRR